MNFVLPKIDSNSPVPLYHQIYSDLRSRIQNGDIPKGHKLPSEKFFSENLNVSRITVKRAINELAAAGLVTRQRGAGTTVTLNTAVPVNGGFENMLQTVIAMRKNTVAKLHSRKTDTAPSKARANLKLGDSMPAEAITYTLSLNGAPFSYACAILPASLSQSFSDTEIERESLLALQIAAGTQLVRADQTISAIIANAQQSEALGIQQGAPLLEIHAVMTDDQGRPVQDITSYFPPEIYKYQMTLTDDTEFAPV